MINRKIFLSGLFVLLLFAVFCNDDSNPNPGVVDNPDITPEDTTSDIIPEDTAKTYGAFIVSLEAPDGITPTYTQLQGNMKDGPTPSTTVFEEKDSEGNCRLLVPRIPFCNQHCGEMICVEDDSCQPYPSGVYAGKITVSGLKTNTGSTTFQMDTLRFNYQPIDVFAAYPPFAEGDVVTFTAAGSSTCPGFTLSVKGIRPLVVKNDTISLIDGKPIKLRWEASVDEGNSTIFVMIDISHHGGLKGKIECECPDNGSLDIPADLLKQLKNLGTAGFPKIEITRRATASSSVTNATLVLESRVTKILNIPGLISCWGDSEDECPDGYVCEDAKCVPE